MSQLVPFFFTFKLGHRQNFVSSSSFHPELDFAALWREAATCSSLKHPLLPRREPVSNPELVFLIFVVSLDLFVGGLGPEPDGPGAICNHSIFSLMCH